VVEAKKIEGANETGNVLLVCVYGLPLPGLDLGDQEQEPDEI
jgi:hypothetical protein